MPTYEYECTRCGHICEEFKPISAPRRQRCPKCRSKVERLISGGVGIVFKGSGFYVNDARPGKPTAEKKSPEKKTSTAKPANPASGTD